MKLHRGSAGVFVVVLLMAACTSAAPETQGVLTQSFDDVDSLMNVLPCDGQWHSLSNTTIGDQGEVSSRDDALARSTDLMGFGARPVPVDAVQAGRVWVLLDRTGSPIGGLEPVDRVVWCQQP